MKKTITALLLSVGLLLCCLCGAQASSLAKAERYEALQQELHRYFDGDDAMTLEELQSGFDKLNYKKSILFSYYVAILHDAELEHFGNLELYVELIQPDEDFLALLEEKNFPSLGELKAYALGRQAESKGDWPAAIEYYKDSSAVLDSVRRRAALLIARPTATPTPIPPPAPLALPTQAPTTSPARLTKAEIYEAANHELHRYLTGNESMPLSYLLDIFESLGTYNKSVPFSYYTAILRDTAEGDYTHLALYTTLLRLDEGFAVLLEEAGFPSVDEVEAYALGRQAEAAGDWPAAITYYEQSIAVLDSLTRVAQLWTAGPTATPTPRSTHTVSPTPTFPPITPVPTAEPFIPEAEPFIPEEECDLPVLEYNPSPTELAT